MSIYTHDVALEGAYVASAVGRYAHRQATRTKVSCSSERYGGDDRIRTYGTRYQKPLPYHLATPQLWRRIYPSPRVGARAKSDIFCSFINKNCCTCSRAGNSPRRPARDPPHKLFGGAESPLPRLRPPPRSGRALSGFRAPLRHFTCSIRQFRATGFDIASPPWHQKNRRSFADPSRDWIFHLCRPRLPLRPAARQVVTSTIMQGESP